MNRSWRNLIKVDFLMSETTDAEGVFCSAFIYNWAGFFLVIHCRQSLALPRVQKETFEKELDFRHIFKFYFQL